MKNYEIRIAVDEDEMMESLMLRRRVFVDEQQLFEENDTDENDKHAIILNAWSVKTRKVIGTVRCYEDQGNEGVWWGGRLAVDENYRIKGIGVYLIRAAIETVTRRGARQFFASVQIENVPLFKKLGWIPVGEVFNSFGHPHQKMEADLYVRNASSL